MNKETKKSDYDFLTESIVNISKAGAYDAISQDYGKVKADNELLKAAINKALDEITNAASIEIITNPAGVIQKVSRPLLDALKQTL